MADSFVFDTFLTQNAWLYVGSADGVCAALDARPGAAAAVCAQVLSALLTVVCFPACFKEHLFFDFIQTDRLRFFAS